MIVEAYWKLSNGGEGRLTRRRERRVFQNTLCEGFQEKSDEKIASFLKISKKIFIFRNKQKNVLLFLENSEIRKCKK